jgi:mycothiol synthase
MHRETSGSVISMKGIDVEVVTRIDVVLANDIAELLERVARANGSPALSERKRLALLTADGVPTDSSGDPRLVAGLVARDGGHTGLVGFTPMVGDPGANHYTVEVAADPLTDHPSGVADLLVDAAVGHVVRLGGGVLRLWSPRATADDDARAAAHGLHLDRNLIQMRCHLPLSDAVGDRRPVIRTRPFRLGQDEAAWLATNNRAFSSHPEQGHWVLGDLTAREQEPWFDPEGLLLLEEDGRVAGSCWTKIHADTAPPMGEIFVIGIDPDFRGRGWGRGLAEAGLDWLAERGLTMGMLYVDADNTAAVSLYRSMGFVDHHVDRAYVGHFD